MLRTVQFQDYMFQIDDRSLIANTRCYLGHKLEANQPLNVILVVFEANGLGDLVFGVKFAEYLVTGWPSLHVTILTSNEHQPGAFRFVQQPLLSYLDVTINTLLDPADPNYKVQHRADGRITVINGGGRTTDAFHLNTDDTDKSYHILFVVPSLGPPGKIRIDGKHASVTMDNLLTNSYQFGEYNSGGLENEDILTGVPSARCNFEQVGLMLESFDTAYPLPAFLTSVLNGRTFSLFYCYASNFVDSQVDGPLMLFHNQTQNKVGNLILAMASYLENLRALPNAGQIVVVMKKGSRQAFTRFGRDVEVANAAGDFTLLGLGGGRDLTDERITKIVQVAAVIRAGKTRDFEFIDWCPVPKTQALALYQRSLPVIMVSGDQSLTDFISVNPYFHRATVYYQVFGWKRDLAESMGIPAGHGVGKIASDRLKEMKTDPRLDFRLKGLTIVESLLVRAWHNREGHAVNGCPPFDQCAGGDQLGVDVYARIVKSILDYQDDFLYEVHPLDDSSIIQLRMKAGVQEFVGHLQFLPQYMANWFKGSKAGNIHLNFYPYGQIMDNHQPQQDSTCTQLNFPVLGDPFRVSSGIMSIGAANLCNMAIQRQANIAKATPASVAAMSAAEREELRQVQSGDIPTAALNLAFAYGSLDTTCMVNVPIRGMVICREYNPMSIPLNTFLSSKECTVYDMCSILYQVIRTLRALNTALMGNLIHNDMGNYAKMHVVVLPNNEIFDYYGAGTITTRYLFKMSDFGRASCILPWSHGERIYTVDTDCQNQNPVNDLRAFMNGYLYFRPFANETLDALEVKTGQVLDMFKDPKYSSAKDYVPSDFPVIFQGNPGWEQNLEHGSRYQDLIDVQGPLEFADVGSWKEGDVIKDWCGT
jgi:hypothetical protein